MWILNTIYITCSKVLNVIVLLKRGIDNAKHLCSARSLKEYFESLSGSIQRDKLVRKKVATHYSCASFKLCKYTYTIVCTKY